MCSLASYSFFLKKERERGRALTNVLLLRREISVDSGGRRNVIRRESFLNDD